MKFEELLRKINNNPYEFAEKHTVSTLKKILRKLSQHYYITKKQLVSDYVFNIMKDELEKKDSNNNFLKEIGAPISKDSEIYYNRIKLLINQNRILRKHNIYLKNVFNYHNEEIYQLTRKFKRYTRKY